MRRRPAGADNFLKWRRSIAEHLELGRMTWHEFAMFAWLCTKATPQTGILRTSWPTLARETGLSADHVEQVCRALKRKRYVFYPPHRGARRRLVEVAIDKYPTADGRYTDLSSRFQPDPARPPSAGAAAGPADASMDLPMGRPTEAPTARPPDVPMARPTDVPSDLRPERIDESRGWPPGRPRRERETERERERDRECARARDGRSGKDAEDERDRQRGRDRAGAPGPAQAGREDLAAPVAIREILAAQPWWRPPADAGASAPGADAGGIPDGARATAGSEPPPGGSPR